MYFVFVRPILLKLKPHTCISLAPLYGYVRGDRTFFGTLGLGYFKLGNSGLPLAGSGIHHFNFSGIGEFKYFLKREFGIRPLFRGSSGLDPFLPTPICHKVGDLKKLSYRSKAFIIFVSNVITKVNNYFELAEMRK
jgi:hypothetical protein